jgi:hypothetical protein
VWQDAVACASLPETALTAGVAQLEADPPGRARKIDTREDSEVRIHEPAQVSHSKLREFAIVAAWISTVAKAESDLEDLLIAVPPAERVLPDFRTPWPWEFDSFVVAHSIMTHTRQAAQQGLAELVATWLGEDRENWPVFRLTLIDPWQERPGIWSEETPAWVRPLGAVATTAQMSCVERSPSAAAPAPGTSTTRAGSSRCTLPTSRTSPARRSRKPLPGAWCGSWRQ